MSQFDRAFEHVIGLEGGYVNDPRDPGGETKYGITRRDHPDVDIAALTPALAKEIYRNLYWLSMFDELQWPLAAFVFDAAVNQGGPTAAKLLQKAADTAQDGIIGQNTMRAINAKNQRELCALFMADRALRYTGTRNFDLYGRGWLKRLFVLAMEA